MNTFVPELDYYSCAEVLTNQHLGKQITEAFQIYKANFLGGPSPGNPHAYAMWPEPWPLMCYGLTLYMEWQERLRAGQRSGSLCHKSGEDFKLARQSLALPLLPYDYPEWWNDLRVHDSHCSNLLFKGRKYAALNGVQRLTGLRSWVWLTDNGYPKSHALQHEHVESIEAWLAEHGGKPGHNHYAQFGWDVPDNLEYHWPL